MKRLRNPSLLLAAALQVMPVCRTVCTLPAVGSTFAIVLRWTIGAAVATGAFDGISGASAPVIFTSPTNFTGTVGVPFNYYVTITNNAGDPGAFFVLTNKSGVVSAALYNGNSTTSCMPAGLTFKCYDLNTGGSPQPIYGTISGTPTTPVTNLFVHVLCGFTGQIPAETNIYITIFPATSQAPVISNQPASVTNAADTTATFRVVAGGTAPLAYQWRKNDASLSNGGNISGATTTNLTLTTVSQADAASYTVVITNSVGSITSAVAILTVIDPPAIASPPANRTNAAGTTATFAVSATGTGPLSYQWRKNGVGFSNGGNVSGATTTNLTLTSVSQSDAASYTVAITNSAGSVTSAVATLTVLLPPAITSQPTNQTSSAGTTVAFTVSATGADPLSYQWRFFGTNNLAGATSSSMTLSKIHLADAGDYSVVITNTLGAVTSSVATLNVTVPPPPVITVLPQQGNLFRFSFVPIVGLTNQVWKTNTLGGDSWELFTNIPPPVSASSITITDVIAESLHCYRVSFEP